MRKDKNQALKLRLVGRSYNEISQALNIPKSTLSGWFSELELSQRARERIAERVHAASLKGLLRRNKNQTHLALQRARSTRAAARQEVNIASKRELKILGAALYWAEGYKRPQIRNGREVSWHSVALTNSDPHLIRVFLRFLREVCEVPVEKIRADIRLYEHMNEEKTFQFWQKATGLPKENFGKFYYGVSKSSLGRRPYNRLPYGTILIRVNDTSLFHKIMGWVEALGRTP